MVDPTQDDLQDIDANLCAYADVVDDRFDDLSDAAGVATSYYDLDSWR